MSSSSSSALRPSTFTHSSQSQRKLIEVLLDDLLAALGIVQTSSITAPDPLQSAKRLGQVVRFVHTLLTLQLNVLRFAEPVRPAVTSTRANVTRFRVGNETIRETLFLGATAEEVAAAVQAAAEGFYAEALQCVVHILSCLGWEPEAVPTTLHASNASAAELWFSFTAFARGNDAVVLWAQHVAESAQLLRRTLEVAGSCGTSRGGVKDFVASQHDAFPSGERARLADDAASLNALVSDIVVSAGDVVRHGGMRAIDFDYAPSHDRAAADAPPPAPPPRGGGGATREREEEGASGDAFTVAAADGEGSAERSRPRRFRWGVGTYGDDAKGEGDALKSSRRPLSAKELVLETVGCSDIAAVLDNVREGQRRRAQPKAEVVHNKAVDALLAAPGTATREATLLKDAVAGFREYLGSCSPLPVEAKIVAANNLSLACSCTSEAARAAGRGASADPSAALAEIEASLAWLPEVDHDAETHVILLNTVAIARAQTVSTLPLAVPCLERAILIATREALAKMKLVLLHNLARVHERLREYDAALAAAAEALAMTTEQVDKGMLCRLLGCQLMCLVALRRGVEALEVVRRLHELRSTHLPAEHNVWSVETEITKAPLLPKALPALTVYGRFRVFSIPLVCGTTTTQQQLYDSVYRGLVAREQAAGGGGASGKAADGSCSSGVVESAIEALNDVKVRSHYMPPLLGWALWFHITPDRNILLRHESGADKEVTLW